MMLHDTDWASLVIKTKGKDEEREEENVEGDTQASNGFSSLVTK